MKSFRFPNPLVLLTLCILLASFLTYLVPAGQFDRKEDPLTGRNVVVAGTYKGVASAPVNLWEALMAIPRGLQSAGSVIFLVFLSGAAFAVVDKAGSFRWAAEVLMRKLSHNSVLVIPVIMVLFALGGMVINMQEEIIPLVPVMLLLMRRLGYPPIIAVAVSIGAAAIGAAFSPFNPFQVIIAQKLAEVPLLSGMGFRLVIGGIALSYWIWWVMRYAQKRIATPEYVIQEQVVGGVWRHILILSLVVAMLVGYVVGITVYNWEFEQLTVLYFLLGVAVAIIARLSMDEAVKSFIWGLESMAFAGMIIGFAKAIFVVLDQGQIIDTIVNGVFVPVAHLPVALSAMTMMGIQSLLHFAVPSVSGQAVLTMPVLVPLSDLLGLSRNITVLAYQYGAGLAELLVPTNGALMAILAASGVRYEEWTQFLWPALGGLVGIGLLGIGLGIVFGI
ncbi:MAG: YfcC family protein [Bacteroidetes Order II. Incertae sedis bacterium]|nr:YfcC family protein [Bacteroidetes Order II. bacterium]